ncbi:hypothetical protein D3C80_2143480 [compost metagenome]
MVLQLALRPRLMLTVWQQNKVAMILQLYPLQQRVCSIQLKIHRMHFVSIILILIRVCRHYVVAGIQNNSLRNPLIIAMR